MVTFHCAYSSNVYDNYIRHIRDVHNEIYLAAHWNRRLQLEEQQQQHQRQKEQEVHRDDEEGQQEERMEQDVAQNEPDDLPLGEYENRIEQDVAFMEKVNLFKERTAVLASYLKTTTKVADKNANKLGLNWFHHVIGFMGEAFDLGD